ncbi:hypothetical protein PAGA_a2206 [Pseudoalteromonas agarivorans DSM 14585]|uniref:Uncharacterized protein n=1 Tax=Pseudoalteromonas agarivorans DSM 14585 TaxID=1312369 RepID=A0ACA8DWE3_9GAMM|nr:hypothetical protein PAGA_a2206 [Pseudoalteromonas agarivorans DSM 14585]
MCILRGVLVGFAWCSDINLSFYKKATLAYNLLQHNYLYNYLSVIYSS